MHAGRICAEARLDAYAYGLGSLESAHTNGGTHHLVGGRGCVHEHIDVDARRHEQRHMSVGGPEGT